MKKARCCLRVLLPALRIALVMAAALLASFLPLQRIPMPIQDALSGGKWHGAVLRSAPPSPEEWIANAPHHLPHHLSKLRDLSDHAQEKGRYLWVPLALPVENLRFSGPAFAGLKLPYASMAETVCEVALRLGGHAPPLAFS